MRTTPFADALRAAAVILAVLTARSDDNLVCFGADERRASHSLDEHSARATCDLSLRPADVGYGRTPRRTRHVDRGVYGVGGMGGDMG